MLFVLMKRSPIAASTVWFVAVVIIFFGGLWGKIEFASEHWDPLQRGELGSVFVGTLLGLLTALFLCGLMELFRRNPK